jgi:phosphoenolpyruvate carboxylase
VSTLDVGTCVQLARALSIYFQLANVAEQLHRAREQRAQFGSQDGSLRTVVDQLAGEVDWAEVEAVLAPMELRPVFMLKLAAAARERSRRPVAAWSRIRSSTGPRATSRFRRSGTYPALSWTGCMLR